MPAWHPPTCCGLAQYVKSVQQAVEERFFCAKFCLKKVEFFVKIEHLTKLMKERIEEAIREVVDAWRAARGLRSEGGVVVTVPKERAHGDFSTTAALVLAKEAGVKPRELAEELANALRERLAGVAECEVAGPGFINFRLSEGADAVLFDRLLARGERLGFSEKYKGKRANVEYVSANPTGPLTVGHGRNAAVGDVIANLLAAVGYEVTREYYFNDAGNQINVLARSVRTRYRQLLGYDDELEDNGYQGEYIIDIAREIKEEFGDTLAASEDLQVFRERAVAATFAMIKATLARMRVRHDVFFNEHSLYTDGKIEQTLADIKAAGLSYEHEGAVWFKATQFGAEKDRVLVKSSGEPTYRLPDIAYHREKFARGYDLMVDVFGADHLLTYPDVLACLKALGYDVERVKVLIHQFVTVVRDGEVVKMSTRRANYITLDELMDEVGVDATRYFFVMRRLGSHFEFDLELARRQSLDNPVFYVQYAHARICSIMRHCAEVKPRLAREYRAGEVNVRRLREPEEQELMRQLAQFEEVVEAAAEQCEPHRVTNYLEKLAEVFHRYYNQHQIVVEDEELAQARLALVQVTRHVVRNGLQLLGVAAPERM